MASKPYEQNVKKSANLVPCTTVNRQIHPNIYSQNLMIADLFLQNG